MGDGSQEGGSQMACHLVAGPQETQGGLGHMPVPGEAPNKATWHRKSQDATDYTSRTQGWGIRKKPKTSTGLRSKAESR